MKKIIMPSVSQGIAPIIIILVMLTLMVAGAISYMSKKNTCDIDKMVMMQLKNENNTIISEAPSIGCVVTAIKCAAGSCVSPAEKIGCGEKGLVCGKEIYCYCP